MPVYKDKRNNTWLVSYYIKDWTGRKKQTTKRGFKTKREAVDFEQKQLLQDNNDLNMPFSAFVELYRNDMKNRIREHTWMNKNNIINAHIMPFFKDKKVNEITAHDIIVWQNSIMSHRDENGKPYSPTFLKSIHNQLSAIFNHAVRFYDLRSNPAQKVGNMGKGKAPEMQFWTKEEYLKFSEGIMDKPLSYYAFEILYWCGLRLGELLALTKEDFDFENKTVSITKSYQRIEKRDLITPPKTEKSIQTVVMPDFLCEEMKEFMDSLYGVGDTDRVFPVTKSYLHKEMRRGCKATGVKVIRIHDLRHSHVSLLINLGFSAVAIGNRVGHESIDITLRYAHMFPTEQTAMADKLNIERGE
ncbi:MAG: tyrosine-type recombinase/integrase [Oscillospiraceae bacterium]